MEILNKKSNIEKVRLSFTNLIMKVGQKKISEKIYLLEEAYGKR
jgi:hypothetical protein